MAPTSIDRSLSATRKEKATVSGLAAAIADLGGEHQVAVGWNYGTKVGAQEKLTLFEPEVLLSSLVCARGL